MMERSKHEDEVCGACSGDVTRRDFVRDAVGVAAALLVVLGARPAEATGMPVRWTHGRVRGSQDVMFPVPATDGASIDRDHELILVRYHGAAYAFALSCPHQHTMLRWLEQDQRFQCPKHKSKYQPDGTFISGRATRGMDRYNLKLEGSMLAVDMSHAIRQDEDASGWAAAMVAIS